MLLSDLFTYRDDDPFPPDHRTDTKRQRDDRLDPRRNEVDEIIELALVLRHPVPLAGAERVLELGKSSTHQVDARSQGSPIDGFRLLFELRCDHAVFRG